jgi:F-type H+-transporting ATPase subunit epsilon
MLLEIITYHKKIFQGNITSLTVPGSAGCFQILTDHAPIISTLKAGKVVYIDESSQNHDLFIEKGMLSAHNNQIKLLVEMKHEKFI